MLEIDKKRSFLKVKEIWFSDTIFDVKHCQRLVFRACKKEFERPDFQQERFTTLTLDLTKDLESIWQGMDKSSCRYAIHRAEEDGVKVFINEHYKEFYGIYRQFNRNKGLPIGWWRPSDMQQYGVLFTAALNDKVIAGNFYLEDEGNIRWLLGASQRLENVTKQEKIIISNASRLIIWEAIKYAKLKGKKEFDFGGYYTGIKPDKQKEGINAFKKSFGGEIKTYYNYQKNYSILYKALFAIYSLVRQYL